ncbi:MAG TPA: proton-conducting transporter membrane subunit [Candidatus Binataceae bacterium]|nr:proton-conducting transporter membrane subunit [Candidatus Binataceae bacterium]
MILIVILAVPLLAALISCLPLGRRLAPAVTLTSCALELAMVIAAAMRVAAGGSVVAIANWVDIDGLSALILLLVATVGSTAALFSWGYMAREPSARRLRRYYSNYNLFVFAMLSVPMLAEPNLVWTGVELTTILSLYLVAFENTHEALEAAWKYSVLTIMGGAVALLGFLTLFAATRGQYPGGAYTWHSLVELAPRVSPAVLATGFVPILVGFGAKVGLVPLHTWLPDAHSQAPSPICALLSGIKTTVILYVILRLVPVLNASGKVDVDAWAMIVGLFSVGIAAFLIIQVTDYKRLFAFSTVEHMGIILTAAGIGGVAGHYGAVYQILNHALTKSFCFYAAGATLLAVDTRQIADVRGLIRTSPSAAVALLFGGIAIAGAPPLAVFLSEFSILRSGIAEQHYVATGLLAAFVIVAFFGILYHLNRMVFGRPVTSTTHSVPIRLPRSCVLTLILASAPIIILGVYMPQPLHRLLEMAASGLSR